MGWFGDGNVFGYCLLFYDYFGGCLVGFVGRLDGVRWRDFCVWYGWVCENCGFGMWYDLFFWFFGRWYIVWIFWFVFWWKVLWRIIGWWWNDIVNFVFKIVYCIIGRWYEWNWVLDIIGVVGVECLWYCFSKRRFEMFCVWICNLIICCLYMEFFLSIEFFDFF